MAKIGGLSSGTSSSVSMYGASMKGYGGLASGLDTDSLIEGMTLSTRTKIQTALKKQTTYQWQMDAYRSITDKLIGFSKKYLDIGNANSPYRASFFDKTLATAKGSNSKYLNVSGTSTTLDNMSVLGIKQLAKDTSLVTNKDSSQQLLNTGEINFGADKISKLDGGSMVLKYGKYNYTLSFTEDSKVLYRENGTGDFKEATLDFSTADKSIDSINQLMNSINLLDDDGNAVLDADGKNIKLGSKIMFTKTGSSPDINFAIGRTSGGDTTELTLAGGSEDALKALGFMKDDGFFVDDGVIAAGTLLKGITEAKDETVATDREFADFMEKKQITFSYNGVAKSIKLPEKDAQIVVTNPDGTTTTKNVFDDAESFAAYLNKELASAFGTGKITVKGTNATGDFGSLSFKTTDKSSVFKISDADKGIMGKTGVLGIGYATTNRLNREVSLAESGLAGIPKGFGSYDINPADGKKIYREFLMDDNGNFLDANGNITSDPAKKVSTGLNTLYDTSGKLLIEANGKKVEGLNVDSTLLQITSAINSSDAGIKLTYVETGDRFSIKATNPGEAGKIEFGAAGSTSGPTDFLKTLFGADPDGSVDVDSDYSIIKGQDAIMTVKYEGNAEVDIKRDSNSFNLDGATFTLNETFGYTKNADGTFTAVAGTEQVTFSTSVDADKVVGVVKEMISDYNKVLEETFKQVGTKPNRDYGPLTDDEKSQLNTSDIEKYEAKAKEGILFNDSLLRSLSDQLRSVFSGVTDVGTLKNMGIEMSGDYSSNGAVSFDETKFKNALSENPEKMKELFTKPQVKDAAGNVTDPGGFSVRLKSITDSFAKYEGLPKGSLVDKAGTTKSVTSVNQNALKTLMNEIDKQVEALKDKLQTEIDRYTKQFSTLEQLVSQMNSQSSWLSQALGG